MNMPEMDGETLKEEKIREDGRFSQTRLVMLTSLAERRQTFYRGRIFRLPSETRPRPRAPWSACVGACGRRIFISGFLRDPSLVERTVVGAAPSFLPGEGAVSSSSRTTSRTGQSRCRHPSEVRCGCSFRREQTEAVEEVDKNVYDLLLMDVQIP